MTELKKIEAGLVPVYETSTGEKVVYGTELHDVLGVKSNYRDWSKNRLKDIDAIENEDYEPAKILASSGQNKKEHIIKLDIAKEMAMLERNEKGRQVSKYLEELGVPTCGHDAYIPENENSYKSGSIQYIDSREVAELVEKKHCNLTRDIGRYMKELTQLNFEFTDFFIESSYKDISGKSNKCYLITKKGCEFIAHKLTGIKGTKFTATYINRFHEMEDALDSQTIPVLQQFMEQQQKFNQQQEDFNQIMLEKINSLQILQGRNIEEDSISVCVEEESESERRRRMLNQLVGKMAKACGWNRNFALHRLYKGLENVLDIALDDYVKIHQAEMGDIYVSTLDVVISYDRLYETAVRLCTNTINGMKC